MNLKLIDSAIAGYAGDLDEGDAARLSFFRKLWGVQDECSQELRRGSGAAASYDPPVGRDLDAAYRDRRSVFSAVPVDVDAEVLAACLDRLSDAVVETSLFPDAVNDGLSKVKWDRVIRASDMSLSGSNPSAWLDDLGEVLVDDGLDDEVAHLGALLASMALKVQMEKPAQAAMEALKGVTRKGLLSPLDCPVCGSAPMMAHIGGETSSSGRGRLLVCPQCGATWEFERIRCARCGTQHQAHLHFFNVEGDEAHRIATCDKCGGYIRTLFSEDTLSLCSYEVEDVVMTRLDAIAQQPELAAASAQAGEARAE